MKEKKQYCKCIADTTVAGINVDEIYEFHTIGNTYSVHHNETDTTFENCYGTKEWFNKHFAIINIDDK